MQTGFDIGASKARFVVVSPDGEVLSNTTTVSRGWRPEDACEWVKRQLESVDTLTAPLGIAVAAQLSPDGGTIVNAPNLSWTNVAFRSLLRKEIDHEVRVYNDLNAAVFAEAKIGAAKGFGSVLGVFVGSGVGGAILENGQLITGAANVAGEIGHVKVSIEPTARLCGCGQRGCLEAYVGGVHLEAMIAELVPAMVAKSKTVDIARADDMLEENDSIELIWHRGADMLSTCIANACTLLNPGVLVLGGGVLTHAPNFKKRVLKNIARRVGSTAATSLEIRFSELGDRAGAIGAAYLAGENMTEATPDLIRDILNHPSAVKWVPLSALKAGEYLSCIDGRHENCIVATPGGDVGLFIAIVTAIEAQVGPLEERFLNVALDIVMEWHYQFYLHTDDTSVNAMFETLLGHVDVTLDPGATPSDFFRQPPVDLQELLLQLVIQPQYVGCGFLKSMLKSPESFGVRRAVVEYVMVEFYRRLWGGATSPYLEILAGQHEEEAIIYVDTRSHDESSTSYVPALRGTKDGPSKLFVNHRPARQFLTHENLRLLARAGKLPTEIDVEQAIEFVDALCDRQLETILEMLAPDLPRFELTFDHMGNRPEVTKRQ